MSSIRGGKKWTPFSTCTAQCFYRRSSTYLCEECYLVEWGRGEASCAVVWVTSWKYEISIKLCLNNFVQDCWNVKGDRKASLKKWTRACPLKGLVVWGHTSEFKIYDATAAKASLKIASSKFVYLFRRDDNLFKFWKLSELPWYWI